MFLLYIIEYLGKEIPADSIALVNQCFNLLILLVAILFGIINILGYFWLAKSFFDKQKSFRSFKMFS